MPQLHERFKRLLGVNGRTQPRKFQVWRVVSTMEGQTYVNFLSKFSEALKWQDFLLRNSVTKLYPGFASRSWKFLYIFANSKQIRKYVRGKHGTLENFFDRYLLFTFRKKAKNICIGICEIRMFNSPQADNT